MRPTEQRKTELLEVIQALASVDEEIAVVVATADADGQFGIRTIDTRQLSLKQRESLLDELSLALGVAVAPHA